MKFLNGHTNQIEKITAADESRYSINNVWLNAEKGHLVATNGHALVCLHVIAEEGDVTGWITPESLRVYRKLMSKIPKYSRNLETVSFIASEKELVITDHEGNRQSLKRPGKELGQFPNYEAVIPKGFKDEPAFTLDVKLLLKVVEALGFMDTLNSKQSSMVAVFPSKDNKTAHLVKTSMTGPLGIIMPMKADDEKTGWLTSIAAVDARFAKTEKERKEAAARAAEAAVQAAKEEEEWNKTHCSMCEVQLEGADLEKPLNEEGGIICAECVAEEEEDDSRFRDGRGDVEEDDEDDEDLEADPETKLDEQDPDMGDCGTDEENESQEVPDVEVPAATNKRSRKRKHNEQVTAAA
jgi:hypothetical protein